MVDVQPADAALGHTEPQDRLSDPGAPGRKPIAVPTVKVSNTTSDVMAIEVGVKFQTSDFLHTVYENRTNADQVLTIILTNRNPLPVTLGLTNTGDEALLPEIPVNEVATQSITVAKGQALFVRGAYTEDAKVDEQRGGEVSYTLLLPVSGNVSSSRSKTENPSKASGPVPPSQ